MACQTTLRKGTYQEPPDLLKHLRSHLQRVPLSPIPVRSSKPPGGVSFPKAGWPAGCSQLQGAIWGQQGGRWPPGRAVGQPSLRPADLVRMPLARPSIPEASGLLRFFSSLLLLLIKGQGREALSVPTPFFLACLKRVSPSL